MIRACSALRPIFWIKVEDNNNVDDQNRNGDLSDDHDEDDDVNDDLDGHLFHNICHSNLMIKLDIDQS